MGLYYKDVRLCNEGVALLSYKVLLLVLYHNLQICLIEANHSLLQFPLVFPIYLLRWTAREMVFVVGNFDTISLYMIFAS